MVKVIIRGSVIWSWGCSWGQSKFWSCGWSLCQSLPVIECIKVLSLKIYNLHPNSKEVLVLGDYLTVPGGYLMVPGGYLMVPGGYLNKW